MKFSKYTIIFFAFVSLIISSKVFAGSISIEQKLPETSTIHVGDEILLTITLDSQNTEYNAIEGELTISPNFTVSEIITGNSFISVWLENPQDHASNIISFSGITPSGYNNQQGEVFSMILKSQSRGVGSIAIDKLSLFQNDGLGTRESKSKIQKNVTITNLPEGKEPYVLSIADINKPEIVKAELVREYDLYDGDWALVFLGVDKGSGVESFDVIEGAKIFDDVTSPYRLRHQRLTKRISVQATDADGNQALVFVDMPGRFCVGNNCYGVVEIVLVILVVFGIFMIRFWKNRPKR